MPKLGPSFQGSQLHNQLGRQRNLPVRMRRFGAVKNDFGAIRTQINALKGLINTQEAGLEIKVGPGERANFAYAKSGLQAEGYPKIVVAKVPIEIQHKPFCWLRVRTCRKESTLGVG